MRRTTQGAVARDGVRAGAALGRAQRAGRGVGRAASGRRLFLENRRFVLCPYDRDASGLSLSLSRWAAQRRTETPGGRSAATSSDGADRVASFLSLALSLSDGRRRFARALEKRPAPGSTGPSRTSSTPTDSRRRSTECSMSGRRSRRAANHFLNFCKRAFFFGTTSRDRRGEPSQAGDIEDLEELEAVEALWAFSCADCEVFLESEAASNQ